MRYSNIGHVKENGVIYTPKLLAGYLASKMLCDFTIKNQDEIKILDPAIGGGELVSAILEKIIERKYVGRISVIGFETDVAMINSTVKRIEQVYHNVTVQILNEDFLTYTLNNKNLGWKFDFIIANPPYIRTQILGAEKAQWISNQFGLNGRVDIYYAFLIYAKNLLNENGVAGFITSNKFMKTKAGAVLRSYMIENTNISKITDFGDTKQFNAAVLPCVIVFSVGKTIESNVNFTSIYETTNDHHSESANDIFEKIDDDCSIKLGNGKTFLVKQGTLKINEKGSEWSLSSAETADWLRRVEERTFKRFIDVGKIRVGIKTTADNVFIKEIWPQEEPELLRPLITHRNAGQFVTNNKAAMWKVLYPHTIQNGKKTAIDIFQYPKTKSYLEKHQEQLSGRKYIAKANRNWYEIWVPQNPASWSQRKIIFRDIVEQPQFWLDDSGAIVNGDCYWIELFDDVSEDTILLLLAVANSTFIEKYYDVKFNNKLYAGKRRFMSQYVEQFPIPDPENQSSQEAISLTKKILAGNLSTEEARKTKKKIDAIVENIFN